MLLSRQNRDSSSPWKPQGVQCNDGLSVIFVLKWIKSHQLPGRNKENEINIISVINKKSRHGSGPLGTE